MDFDSKSWSKENFVTLFFLKHAAVEETQDLVSGMIAFEPSFAIW